MIKRPNTVKGKTLRVAAGIGHEYGDGLAALVAEMHRDARKVVTSLYRDIPLQAMDDTISSQSRFRINALFTKWQPRFTEWAARATKRMIGRTLRNSDATLKSSLKEISEKVTLNTRYIDKRLKEIITASSNEAAGLIKLIPQTYLTQVQGAVARSIANGKGLADLVPFFIEKYKGDVKHAKLVAMDQTRKTYSNINAARMQSIKLDEYEWVHSGGSQHPRKLHIEMSGNIYSLSKPPIIGKMYGENVRGKPGDVPNCRCIMRPIIRFKE